MQTKFNFTAGRIEKLQYLPKTRQRQTLYWDDRTPGLGLRVTSTGVKSYIFQSSLFGKAIRTTIGDVRTWKLADARSEATHLKSMIDRGIDPREHKEELKRLKQHAENQKKLEMATVQDAWDTYIDYYSKHGQRKWGARHLQDHLNLSQKGGEPKKRGKGLSRQGVLYPLLQLKLVEITSDRLIAWIKIEASSRPNNARQGFEMFRAFWRWCNSEPEYRQVIDVEAISDKRLLEEIPARKSKRNEVLQKSQLRSWFQAVSNISNPVIGSYLQILLLTGARRNELAELRWEHVDMTWNSIWLHDKVDKDGRIIPLTPYVRYLINKLPKRNEWVFSSPGAASGRIAEPRKAHNDALTKAALNHLSLHALRRTFKSLSEWREIPVGVIAQIMGHKPSATAEKHYTARPLELLAVHHSGYEAWILKQANIEFQENQPKLSAIS